MTHTTDAIILYWRNIACMSRKSYAYQHVSWHVSWQQGCIYIRWWRCINRHPCTDRQLFERGMRTVSMEHPHAFMIYTTRRYACNLASANHYFHTLSFNRVAVIVVVSGHVFNVFLLLLALILQHQSVPSVLPSSSEKSIMNTVTHLCIDLVDIHPLLQQLNHHHVLVATYSHQQWCICIQKQQSTFACMPEGLSKNLLCLTLVRPC